MDEIARSVFSLSPTAAFFILLMGTARALGALFGLWGMYFVLGPAAMLRIVLAMIISAPMIVAQADGFILLIETTPRYGVMLIPLREFVIGFGLGLLTSLPFFSVLGAAMLIDQYRGDFSPGIQGPEGLQIGSYASLNVVMILFIFVEAGGFFVLISVLYSSFGALPPALPGLTLAPDLEKTDQPSERKLAKLREDGMLPSSETGTNFFAFAVGLAITMMLFNSFRARINGGFTLAFDSLGNADVTEPGFLRYYLIDLHLPILAILVGVIVASILFKTLVHGGFVVSMKRIEPKLEKVSPAKGFKELFKGRVVTEFFVTIWGPTFLRLDLCVPSCAEEIVWAVIKSILIASAAFMLISIALDVGMQRAFFMIEQRMTKTEMKKEMKEMLGQPEVRQERKRLQRDSAAMAGTVGAAVATVYFTYGDRVVGLIFHPTKVPLPKIAAKSRDARGTIEMIRNFESRGLPGKENEKIVEACETLPNGSAVPRSIFETLAHELRDMMA